MLTEVEAQEVAARALRFEIGTIPHLGTMTYSDETKTYHAPIMVSYPRLDEGDDVAFDWPEVVGEMRVDAVSGEASYTPSDVISERIERIKERDTEERRRHPLAREE